MVLLPCRTGAVFVAMAGHKRKEHRKPQGYVTFCLVYSGTPYILWSSLGAHSLAVPQSKPLVGSPRLSPEAPCLPDLPDHGPYLRAC